MKQDNKTPAEEPVQRLFAEAEHLHALWHAFHREVIQPIAGEGDLADIRDQETKLKLMDAADAFAENHPEVQTAGCDDSYFCGSDIWVIPHRHDESLMGATFLYIPQCDSQSPAELFLYPSHAKSLMKALTAIFGQSVESDD